MNVARISFIALPGFCFGSGAAFWEIVALRRNYCHGVSGAACGNLQYSSGSLREERMGESDEEGALHKSGLLSPALSSGLGGEGEDHLRPGGGVVKLGHGKGDSGEGDFGGGRFGIPAARGRAGDGSDVLEGNLPAARLGAFDFDFGRVAGLLIDFLIGRGFVADIEFLGRVRLEEQDPRFWGDAMIDLVQDGAAESEAFQIGRLAI